MAIRTGQPCVCRDLANDPRFKPWRAEALKRGYGSALALPLLAAPANLGVMAIYSAQPQAFDDSEVQLLEQLSRDLSFGILSLRGRADRAELTRQVLDISEREQRRLGQDLHDGVGQSIIGIGYLISAVQQNLVRKNVHEAAELDQIKQMVGTTVQQAHDLARGLFPEELRRGGITDALQELARRTQDMFGMVCDFRVETPVRLADANLASQVYRIAQEAVNNAVKHSKAPMIHIRLAQRSGRIILTVRDTGVGFTPQAGSSGGMGQRIMKYRADLIGATLKVESACGKGTTVTCALPRKPGNKGRESLGNAPLIPGPLGLRSHKEMPL
jgi:signal transduction histidine kinase